jgi:hypothetical protein
MPEYCGCRGKFVSPHGEPEDWEVTWELTPCGPLYHQVLVFWFRFRYACELRELHYLCISFVTQELNVITLYSGHVCDVLCINASVLGTHKDPG